MTLKVKQLYDKAPDVFFVQNLDDSDNSKHHYLFYIFHFVFDHRLNHHQQYKCQFEQVAVEVDVLVYSVVVDDVMLVLVEDLLFRIQQQRILFQLHQEESLKIK